MDIDEASQGRKYKGWVKQGRCSFYLSGLLALIRSLLGRSESVYPHHQDSCSCDIFMSLSSGYMNIMLAGRCAVHNIVL